MRFGGTSAALTRDIRRAIGLAPADPLILKTYNYTPAWSTNFTLPPQDANGWSILPFVADGRVMYISNDGDDTAAAADGVYLYGDGSTFTDWYDETGKVAFATPSVAMSYMRQGFPDRVLFREGDVFTTDGSIGTVFGGRSLSERMVFGSYGNGARPIINQISTGTYSNGAFNLNYTEDSFVAFIGLEFTATNRNPTHPDFLGWANLTTNPAGIRVNGRELTGNGPVGGVLVEGCKFSYLARCIAFDGVGQYDGSVFSEIVGRRIIMHDIFKGIDGGHPIALPLSYGSFYFEDLVFVRCGFYDTEDSTLPEANPLTHSAYCVSLNDSYFSNILSYNPSSIHMKFTANVPADTSGYPNAMKTLTALDGAAETQIEVAFNIPALAPQTGTLEVQCDGFEQELAAALTGAGMTSVVIENPIPVNTPATGQLRIGNSWEHTVNYTSWSGSTFTIEESNITMPIGRDVDILSLREIVTYTSWVNNVFTINSTDFTSKPASIDARVSFTRNILMSENINVSNFTFIDGEVGLSYGGNVDVDDTYPRFKNFNAQGGVLINIGKSQNTGRNIGWGIEPLDCDESEISENLFLPIDNAAVTNTFATNSVQYGSNINTYNNHNAGMVTATSSNYENAFDSGDFGETYNNASDIPPTEYVNPNATLETYHASIGGDGSLEGFANDAIALEYGGVWDDRYLPKKINEYFRKAFALKNNFYINNQPANLTVASGETATFTADVIGNTRLTFEWYLSDVLVSGETGYKYDLVTSASNDGDTVKWKAFDENGNSIESSSATLSISGGVTSQQLFMNGASFVQLSGINLLVGDIVELQSNLLITGSSYSLLASPFDLRTASSGTIWSIPPTYISGFTYNGNARVDLDSTAADESSALLPLSFTVATDGSLPAIASRASNANNLAPSGYSFSDLKVTRSGTLIHHIAFDSGSTTTEDDLVGAAVATFVGVDASNWVSA